MPGHSTVVHQAVGPAPAAEKELVHVEAKPHRGGIKIHAHVMEGGKLSKHEHTVSDWGEAHEKMGEYMGAAPERSTKASLKSRSARLRCRSSRTSRVRKKRHSAS